jgi:hypothetical protein
MSGVALLLLLLVSATPAAGSHAIGTDLASLNLCFYGDCDARGTYAADPYGLYNPATMTVATLRHVPRGVVLSGSYFHLDIGGTDGDVEVGVVTFAWEAIAFQVATAYAEIEGPVRELPGVDLHFRTRAVRLALGVDGERTLGLRGLSLGIAGIAPGTTSDTRLEIGGSTFVKATETRDVNVVPGLHWRGGEKEWFMIGAFLDATRNGVDMQGLDPVTGTPLRRSATVNTWFARVGVSLLPLVPLGLAGDGTPIAQWLGAVRLATDVEYANLSVPDEGSKRGATAFFGFDAPVLPDALNPLRRWLRVVALGGVDTRGGWGLGAGLYGQGPLSFVGCNPAFSSRPLTEFIGERVDAAAVTCSVMFPL